MNKLMKVTCWMLMGAMAFTSVGCQWMNEHRTATGAGAGALVGAAAGAAIDKDNRGRGALIGAAAGAAVGGGIGYYLQRQKEKFDKIENVQTEQVVVPPPPVPAGQPAPAQPPPAREALRLRMPGDVMFAVGSSALTAQGSAQIAEIATVLKEYPESDVIVRGYTSSEGADDMNFELSQRRAEVVRNSLVSNGVSAARIQALGMGESNPIASNDTEAGRIQNRRVEIDVIPKEEVR